jgi:hypothetical protein
MSLTGFGFSDSAALLKHYKYGPRQVCSSSPHFGPRCRSAHCTGYLSLGRWDAEKLTERYFEDPEKVAAAVVCRPPRVVVGTAVGGCWDPQVSSQCCSPPLCAVGRGVG